MAILCIGTLLAGLAAAAVLPFLPFACAVVVAIVIGAASTVATGGPVLGTGLSAFLILLVSQLGYGLGLGAMALMTHLVAAARRPAAEKHPARPLPTGNEPR